MGPSWPSSNESRSPVRTSHRPARPGPAVTIQRPSELKAASLTPAPCPRSSLRRSPVSRVPDDCVVVVAGRHDELPVGAELGRRKSIRVPEEVLLEPARGDAPDPADPVCSCRDQALPVRTEREVDRVRPRLDQALEPSVLSKVPEHDALRAGRGQHPPVGAERDDVTRSRVGNSSPGTPSVDQMRATRSPAAIATESPLGLSARIPHPADRQHHRLLPVGQVTRRVRPRSRSSSLARVRRRRRRARSGEPSRG